MKMCRVCKELKSLEEFHNNRNFPDGKMRECKPCNNSRANKWTSENKEKRNTPERYLERQVRRHGTTVEAFNKMKDSQNGLCAICQTGEIAAIDHDHKCCKSIYSCGKCIRGLLCKKCNMGIGLFDDNLDLLTGAIKYLRTHMQSQVELDSEPTIM